MMGRAGAGMEVVGGVAAIGDAGAHQDDVVGMVVGEPGERRVHHGTGVAAEHVAPIDVAVGVHHE